jgi:hypothetical protein
MFPRPRSIASNIREEEEDEENALVQDIGKFLADDTASHFRSQ